MGKYCYTNHNIISHVLKLKNSEISCVGNNAFISKLKSNVHDYVLDLLSSGFNPQLYHIIYWLGLLHVNPYRKLETYIKDKQAWVSL